MQMHGVFHFLVLETLKAWRGCIRTGIIDAVRRAYWVTPQNRKGKDMPQPPLTAIHIAFRAELQVYSHFALIHLIPCK